MVRLKKKKKKKKKRGHAQAAGIGPKSWVDAGSDLLHKFSNYGLVNGALPHDTETVHTKQTGMVRKEGKQEQTARDDHTAGEHNNKRPETLQKAPQATGKHQLEPIARKPCKAGRSSKKGKKKETARKTNQLAHRIGNIRGTQNVEGKKRAHGKATRIAGRGSSREQPLQGQPNVVEKLVGRSRASGPRSRVHTGQPSVSTREIGP